MQFPVTVFDGFLLTFSILLLIPFTTLFVECLAALIPGGRSSRYVGYVRPKLAILVPAHNEAGIIQASLKTLIPQVTQQDQLVVIADNCTDNTAELARSLGVTVIERFEPDLAHRGKGYALDYGRQYLAQNPPEVVVTVDADCFVAPNTIERIAQQAYATGYPVQATYVMNPPQNASLKDSISALAIVLKNQVRPLGLSRLGLPNLLTGSGMAFPWKTWQQVTLATSNIVEDMKLGLDLAIAGYAPKFCAEGKVTSILPQRDKAAKNQRTRWEHGHLQTILTEVPRLFSEAIQQRRIGLLALALDVAVPPISLLVMGWLVMIVGAIAYGLLTGFWLPVWILALQCVMLMVCVLGTWFKFERFGLSLVQLLSSPFYAFWKIPVYVKYLLKPQTRWLRTERE